MGKSKPSAEEKVLGDEVLLYDEPHDEEVVVVPGRSAAGTEGYRPALERAIERQKEQGDE